MRFCDDAHRAAAARRAGRAGKEFSNSLRLLYLAADIATFTGKLLRKHVAWLAQFSADYDHPTGDDDLRRALSQARKQLKYASDYLTWAEEGFVEGELSEAVQDELNDLLDSAGIDEPRDDE
jgi:hypothetical protein